MISAIHSKQAQNLNHQGGNYVYSGEYFYTFAENGFDNVVINSKIKIEGNETIIGEIEEALTNGENNRKSENVNSFIGEFYSRQNANTYGNVSTTTGQSNSGNDRMVNNNLSEQAGNNRTADNRQNAPDIGKNDSSFSLSKSCVKQNN